MTVALRAVVLKLEDGLTIDFQETTNTDSCMTRPLKPKPGLNGPPARPQRTRKDVAPSSYYAEERLGHPPQRGRRSWSAAETSA